MILAPPGSAKSTYVSICFPPFVMGRAPRTNVIGTSYGGDLARKFGRRCRQIARSPAYEDIMGTTLSGESSAADEWALTNESEYLGLGILAGVTGHRADGLLVDDPIKGRQEADSETIREKTWEAYRDDLRTRLKPNAFQILILTHWHEDDPAGRLLPIGYDNLTGWVECRDGHQWYVLCLQMEAERDDDPLGRQRGDLLWSEWYRREDILAIKAHDARTWSSLYQQRPAPDEGIYFKREWFRWYAEKPKHLRIYGASDYAVTEGGGDYTVHVVVGIDADSNVYILDVWRGQTESHVWVETFLDLVKQYQPLTWAEEDGQILKSIGPFIDRRMHERQIYCHREQFVTVRDKPTRCRAFQARTSMGKVYLPKDAPWLDALLGELLTFPAGRHDDIVDSLGTLGRLLDTMIDAHVPKAETPNHLDDYRGVVGRYGDQEDGWKTA